MKPVTWTVPVLAIVGVAGLASADRVVTVGFDADRTSAAVGETITWTMRVSWEGFFTPDPAVGGYVGDLLANDPALGVAGGFENLLNFDAGQTTVDGASVLGVNIFQASLLGDVDRSNPIDIFRFDVDVTADTGVLWYDTNSAVHMVVDFWFDPTGSWTQLVTSDEVTIVPGVGGAWVMGLGLAAAGRRR